MVGSAAEAAEKDALVRLIQCADTDVHDQYRMLLHLEQYLRSPLYLLHSAAGSVQLLRSQPTLLARVVELYYEFDTTFARELMGVKLSVKSRKDIDVIASRLPNHLRATCAWRQFRNVRRMLVYRLSVDEGVVNPADAGSVLLEAHQQPQQQQKPNASENKHNMTGNDGTQRVSVSHIVDTLGKHVSMAKLRLLPAELLYQHHFLISERLALLYTRLVFLCRYRFETQKQRLNLCSYADFDFFAQVLMYEWAIESPKDADAWTMDTLDVKFIVELKSVKRLAERKFLDPYGVLVAQVLKAQAFELQTSSAAEHDIDGKTTSNKSNGTVALRDVQMNRVLPKLSALIKSLMNVAAAVPKGKKLRDLFADLVTVCVKPLLKLALSAAEVETFLRVALTTMAQLSATVKSQYALPIASWQRFLRAIVAVCPVIALRQSKQK
jgi:hypothetical protein